MNEGDTRATLRDLIARTRREKEASARAREILPLAATTFGDDEIIEAIETLLSGDLTMGRRVAAFEEAFAEYTGAKHAVMVNSGSSANLVAVTVASLGHGPGPQITPGSEVIVPAVTWSTTAFPVLSVGAIPVFVDVDPDTLCLDPSAVEAAITDRTSAIFLVHLLGFPAAIDEIATLAKAHGLVLLEDCCEALGARTEAGHVGTTGIAGTFSFFFSHHITTIEGGMVITDDDTIADLARSVRAHGWIRERHDSAVLQAEHPELDPRFLFVTMGYNLRPTEVQGAFGIHQIKKLDRFVEQRRRNAEIMTKALKPYSEQVQIPATSYVDRDGRRASWFAFPICVRKGAGFSRGELTTYLEGNGIPTRPIVGGNLAEQPAFHALPSRTAGRLPVAAHAMRNGFYVGNHHDLDHKDLTSFADTTTAFLDERALVSTGDREV